ncbi:MFS transporter [Terribacillus sp. AE2B 122]|uniref:MFS transporter n=1 Tax=Terribacillus sp. AE2B 122 TaxID=1331902 RepID=UPI0015838E70|nr:MFS transporter [Terribacillus sp. AE2B 122]
MSVWKNSNFTKYFFANGLANLGNWFDFIAVLILFRFTWKADPMLIALIPVFYALPSILFGQWAGVLADRWDQRKILIYSDWVRAVLTVILLFSSTPYVALGILLLRSTCGAISVPAQQGFMRRIVEEDQLMQAVSLNGGVIQLVKVVGPLIGGTVVSIFSTHIAMGMNALAFILSALLLYRIQIITSHVERNKSAVKEGVLESWKKGWYAVIHNRIILSSLLFGLLSTLVIQMIDVQLVTLFSTLYPEREELTGWITASIGLGSLVMVLTLNRLEEIRRYGWFFGTGCFSLGLMTSGFGFLTTGESYIFIALGLAFIGGLGNGLVFAGVNYLIQREPPKEMVSRVAGIVDSSLSTLFILGPLLGGFIINNIGVLAAFRLTGSVIALIGIGGIVFQAFIWKSEYSNTKRRSAS